MLENSHDFFSNIISDTLSTAVIVLDHSLSVLYMNAASENIFGKSRAERNDDTVGRIINSDKANQDAIHPAVITHPQTGRKALFVNPTFTLGFEGWSDEESKSLLQYLYLHATKPEFTCRFKWEEGSIAFWDNRSTWHLAVNDYHGERRLMHRITIDGTRLT